MSIIQKIQEKYAKLMAIIIALALIIFVVMLAFENGGSLFGGGPSTTVGKVNGSKIDYNEFVTKVDQYKANIEARSQFGPPPNAYEQAVNQAWTAEINNLLLSSEARKLGMKVGKRELGDVLYGPNGPDDFKRLFTDSITGQYNGQLAKQNVDQLLKMRRGTDQQMAQREQIVVFIREYQNMRLNEKYNSLMNGSVNYPKWYVEKQIADNSQMATVSMVREYYTSVNDSTIKVTDKEVLDYYNKNKHRKDYTQPQEIRAISYVAFSKLPSAADTAAVTQQIENLKSEFDTTTNVQTFLSRNGSAVSYSNVFAGKSLMQMQYKDTIQKLPINGVFGPYIDGGTVSLAKMIEVKELPDSVKCRHILISTSVEQGGFEDSVASKRLDSAIAKIKSGVKWDSVVNQYNPMTDGSRQTKGEMTFSSTQIQGENFAPEFGQFILFDGKPGSTKKVKTSFGWHYIEILSFIKVEPHYKVAYMSKPIEASTETFNNANNEANLFAGNSRNQKSFDANAEKLLKEKGINKGVANGLTANDFVIRQGLGAARPLIKKIFNAKLGEVLEPEEVGNSFVVAIVTEITKAGLRSVSVMRPEIEIKLRNQKIAEKLKQKIGAVTTLEAAAAALGGKAIEPVDSLRMVGTQTTNAARGLSNEPKVVGAIFNAANRNKVIPYVIEGNSGIFVVRVDNVTATPVGDANVDEQRKTRFQQGRSRQASPLENLREAATIKDRRIEFF